MRPKEEPSNEIITRDIQAILEELHELVILKNVTFDPNEAGKNNEAFLELLERLNQLKPLYGVK